MRTNRKRYCSPFHQYCEGNCGIEWEYVYSVVYQSKPEGKRIVLLRKTNSNSFAYLMFIQLKRDAPFIRRIQRLGYGVPVQMLQQWTYIHSIDIIVYAKFSHFE